MFLIGCDIGGTNIKIGLIENKKIKYKLCEPTNKDNLVEQVIELINRIVKENSLKIKDIQGVGVACPGLVSDGVVIHSNNLRLHNLHLQEILSSHFKIDVKVLNDADMATLAEHKLGKGQNVDNMLMLTIGTGVGGGIIINKKLYTGNGNAGEIGHMTFKYDGIDCPCGRKGCVEKYTSLSALRNQMFEKISSTKSQLEYDENNFLQILYNGYINGDKSAKEIVGEYSDMFAEMLCSLCDIFRPNKIVIGGGITSCPEIVNAIASKAKEKHYGYIGSKSVEIAMAELGNDAGILGTCVII